MSDDIKVKSHFAVQFQEFINSLSNGNILKANRGRLPTYKDKQAFMDLGLGLFVAYLVSGIRTSDNSYYFVKVNDHKTLMIVDPVDLPIVPLRARAKMTGLYIDDPQEGFEAKNCVRDTKKCAFEAFLAYNASLTNRTYMARRLKNFRQTEGTCRKSVKRWLENLYDDEKDEELQSLGGYPLRLHISPKVFQYLFSVDDVDEESNFRIAEQNFNMFLTALIGMEFGADIAESEACVERGSYKTYATDGLICDKAGSRIVALETTIGIPDKEGEFITQFLDGLKKADRQAVVSRFAQLRKDHHFKQKFINHTMLKNLGSDRYGYLYCVFGDLVFDDEEYRPAYTNMASSKDFRLITLHKEGRRLVINFRKNWWDTAKIKELYDQFIKELLLSAGKVLSD